MVITACSCQAAFAAGLKVCRIDWGVLVVPGDKERSGLHDCGAEIVVGASLRRQGAGGRGAKRRAAVPFGGKGGYLADRGGGGRENEVGEEGCGGVEGGGSSRRAARLKSGGRRRRKCVQMVAL